MTSAATRRPLKPLHGAIDYLIAQLTLENDGPPLHSDQDLDHIKAMRPLRTAPTSD